MDDLKFILKESVVIYGSLLLGLFIMYLVRKYRSIQDIKANNQQALQMQSGNFDVLDLVEELRFLVFRKKLSEAGISIVKNFLDTPVSFVNNYEIVASKKIATDAYVLLTNCYELNGRKIKEEGDKMLRLADRINFLFRIKADEIEV
jgi:hypothetical protein